MESLELVKRQNHLQWPIPVKRMNVFSGKRDDLLMCSCLYVENRNKKQIVR